MLVEDECLCGAVFSVAGSFADCATIHDRWITAHRVCRNQAAHDAASAASEDQHSEPGRGETCPVCEKGTLTRVECCICDNCDATPVLTDQICRNDKRLAARSGRVPEGWKQPAWRPIDTYPKDQGVYRNGSRVWLWHEDLGICWGFMDDLPSGFRCDLYQNRDGVWAVVACGLKEARKLHYWMPAAPSIPEPPAAPAPDADEREDG